MPTNEIIIRLFCMVDAQVPDVKKRSNADFYLGEIATLGLLFALRGNTA